MTMKTKTPKAEQQKARSLAAFKAHLTRQKQRLAKSRSPAVKRDAREAIKAITANMQAV
jgi:hypothetical protein